MNSKKIPSLGLLIWLTGFTGMAHGHGYVTSPPSRNLLCKEGINVNCGAIQYEPQSLEALSGFPANGPADGRIASANQAAFNALDEQTSSRWVHHVMQQGIQDFSWTFTANHVTRNWRYYITRQDWNPNQPLTRAAFEISPFCSVDGGMQRPSMVVTHSCNIPSRHGYQLVLAVWEIGDTVNSFYNVIDAEFKTDNISPPAWEQRGTISPSVTLERKDSVRTRVFDQLGERSDLSTSLEIGDTTSGQADTWALNLASKINREQTLLKAGKKLNSGEISPVPGVNLIYAQTGSGIQRVEIQIERANSDLPGLDVKGVMGNYPIVEGAVTVPFSLTSTSNLDVTITVYDPNQRALATTSQSLLTGIEAQTTIGINPAIPGTYTLVVVGKDKSTGMLIQKSLSMTLEQGNAGAQYEFVFPQGLAQYKAGVRVLQPLDGHVYECKPWPYSGFCMQWSKSANQYEPGLGIAWSQAWISRQ